MSAHDCHLPELVLNRQGAFSSTKVLSTLKSELAGCTHFRFYVAFVTQSGVVSIIQDLKSLEEKGVRGEVLVSQYLNFTDPLALRSLLKLKNMDLRILSDREMHAKGYFFTGSDTERFLIGSSNWTEKALSQNTELNVFLKDAKDGPLTASLKEEFDHQFSQAQIVDEAFIVAYEKTYRKQSAQAVRQVLDVAQTFPWKRAVKPNSMQQEALLELAKLRSEGETKALVISATGTGKTFLSAFDVEAAGAKRMLFVVHRERIAQASMASFKRIFGAEKTYGMYGGGSHDAGADFVFSTVQTLSRPQHLNAFSPTDFDYIIIDESHHTQAQTYRNILDHFRPKFLLGMTATPEPTSGQDIFQYFDHNVACEIRLQRALKEEMLCPFHYFGVTDLTVGGEEIEEARDFGRLVADERVSRILEKAAFYGTYDGVIRGLVFCSRVEEATALSQLFNVRGYRTIALHGKSTEEERQLAILRLEKPDVDPSKLDYIITVDIFNEGVDIPMANQVLLLRPTESAIVFVQQLGRGLRKVEGEDKYLTVIDFIGNYKANYLIPIALYGDRSFDKDEIRRKMVAGIDILPGSSTINFDLISAAKIFESINKSNLGQKRDLRLDYLTVRNRIGRIPMMMDFVRFDVRQPDAFSEYSRSFYTFSREAEAAFGKKAVSHGTLPSMSADLLKILEVYSMYILNGARLEESLILLALLDHGEASLNDLASALPEPDSPAEKLKRLLSAVRALNLEFMREKSLVIVGDSYPKVPVKENLGFDVLSVSGDRVTFSNRMSGLICSTFITYARDVAQFSSHKYLASMNLDLWQGGFVRGRKYKRSDVFRLLDWQENPVALNVGGYQISSDRANCAIFVTYEKSDDIVETIKYDDKFLSPARLQWQSKNNRTLKSPEISYFKKLSPYQRCPLFVKKSDDEGDAYYYCGELRVDPSSIVQETMSNGKGGLSPVVRLEWNIDQPVIPWLYRHLVG